MPFTVQKILIANHKNIKGNIYCVKQYRSRMYTQLVA